MVIGEVSGRVDSTVAAMLMKGTIGDHFHLFLVYNGVLREDEAERERERSLERCGVNVTVINEIEKFLQDLKGSVGARPQA